MATGCEYCGAGSDSQLITILLIAILSLCVLYAASTFITIIIIIVEPLRTYLRAWRGQTG